MAESVRIIKKYQNRKLYDTQDSCYVTLEGVAKMIREGHEEIVVIDNNTKEDVTALILTQVLYEQEKTNQSVLPVTILKNIIKSGSTNLFEFMQKYILGAFDVHLRTKKDLSIHIERLIKSGQLTSAEGEILLNQVKAMAEKSRMELDKRIEERLQQYLSQSSPQMMASEVNTLFSRISALEARAPAMQSHLSS